jgi:hypothetical protein
MDFSTNWVDGFSGKYSASGQFGVWSIVGGSGTDIYIKIPMKTGTVTSASDQKQFDITGMSFSFEVNLSWIPSTVSDEGKKLQFDLKQYTPKGNTRQSGGIYLMSFEDPKNTGFGEELGKGIAQDLIDNKDKITFIFAQTGVLESGLPSWLVPVKSIYSYQTPSGKSEAYLSILSVTSNKDITNLNANIDPGLIPNGSSLSFSISGDLFLEHIILPALPGTFEHSTLKNFSFSNGSINLASEFYLTAVQSGAIFYNPQVTSMKISIDSNALKNETSGTVYLDLPNAYLSFSAITKNVLNFNPGNQTITFQKDPKPITTSDSHVPWYDYILTLGPIGASITAIVLAAVESGLGDSLANSNLAGNLSSATAKSIDWGGKITVKAGALNDCFIMQADLV